MRYISIIAELLILTSCERDECISCRYHTGEVQELCASQLSYPDIQLPIFEDQMTNSGWVCSRHEN